MLNSRTLFPALFKPAGGGGGSGQTIQVTELPDAVLAEKDKIYQYIGSTTETLTNGYFYKCVEHTTTEGEVITVTYEWENIPVMYVAPPSVSIDIPTNSAVKVGSVVGEDLYAACIVNPASGYNSAQWIMDLHIKDIYQAWGTTTDGRPVNDQSTYKIADLYFVPANGLYITISGSGWELKKLVILFTKTN